MTKNNRIKAIELKQKYLRDNPEAFKGNSSARHDYLDTIENDYKLSLAPYQLEACVGLVLGDASVQYSNNATAARLKMQQSEERDFNKYVLLEVLPEWCAARAPGIGRPATETAEKMSEITTFTCKTLLTVADVFRDPGYVPVPNKVLPKRIKPEIAKYLTPVCLAFWFMTDGGRSDNMIQFNSHCFSKQENELCQRQGAILTDKYGWTIKPKKRLNKDRTAYQDYIALSGTNFDDFAVRVGPYITRPFLNRLPPGRSERSRHGIMTKARLLDTVGSALRLGTGHLIDSYPGGLKI
uniref:Homing endonuclease LAGLIDADG domain-containing protein n=1 Tax=Carteria oliveri TaxID=52037 RepID=Q8SML8_9CHLO|nr:unknown [Carteria olivieri]